ncbi:MAG: peptidylprolyl isomerase [Terriglobia bacterium]
MNIQKWAAIVSMALVTGVGSPTLGGAKIVERIIARVNTEIITQRTYEQEQEKLRQQLAQEYSGAELEAQIKEQSKNLLRDLIDQSLMVQKAKDEDINVETDVVKELDEYRKKNNLATLEDLETEVEKQGLNYEDIKDQIRRRLLVREVIGREVGSRIQLSRDDARKFYEAHKKDFESPGMVRLGQILISTEKRKPEEAEKRANDALVELKAGQRFAEIAKKYSDGPSAEQGGDVGFMKEGTLAPDIAAAVAKLDLNEFSNPIQIRYGYIILKVLERYSPGIPKFEEVEQRVNEVLYDQRMQPNLRQYMTRLRKESYIYKAPGYVDTGEERPSEIQLANKGQ